MEDHRGDVTNVVIGRLSDRAFLHAVASQFAVGRYLHVAAGLVLEGYRCHKRQWRRRRDPLPDLMPKEKKLPTGPVPIAITFARGNAITTALEGDATQADLDAAEILVRRCDKANPQSSDLR